MSTRQLKANRGHITPPPQHVCNRTLPPRGRVYVGTG